jgi:hypothetical protein
MRLFCWASRWVGEQEAWEAVCFMALLLHLVVRTA